ncbi:hypothetical protein [Pyrinomonas methylaliphatogenes]|uniref:Transposase n=1 Tax=Pyrinomonas methylaliphatogenes TaxID=454194 RepID=A0A0B6WXK8_9BACT|nr:hypothetical protein [Pyrinomonas methylaliphatogenes]CDM65998.1 hypothetical protein PYK22_02007 [Pyrinomonas methylaliphatogenes]
MIRACNIILPKRRTCGLCECAIDVKANYLLYKQTDKKDRTTLRTWLSALPLTKKTIEPMMRAGHARWKIETFAQELRGPF